MKRPTLLTAILILAAIAYVGAADSGRNAEAPLAERMSGVWVIVGTPDAVGEIPKTGGPLKFIAGNRWCVVDSSATTGPGGIGGRFTLKGDTYTETVEYAIRRELIGKTLTFKLKVEGDTFTQTGLDNPYTTVLKRPKD